MDPTDEPTSRIYTGVWTNWSRGKVYGATYTLSRSDANLLIAFLAFFITWVGMCFWRVLCFIIHFSTSGHGETDGLARQQKILLRNAADAESGIRMTAMLWHAWRGRARRPFLRLLGLFVLSLGCAILATVASIFSSRISDLGSEVLLNGNNCSARGTYANFADKESDPYEIYHAPLQLLRTTKIENAANYALQCYSGTAARQLECASAVKRRLPLLVQQNATCPFNSSLCKSQDKNVLLDTGYLRSHEDFGINAPPEQRFLYRRVLHCAPLVTEGHKSSLTYSGLNMTSYHYSSPSGGRSNFTYAYSNRTYPLDNPDVVDYTLRVVPSYYQDGLLNPAPPMQKDPSVELTLGKTDADILLVFLSANGIIFSKKTNDLWYDTDGEFIDSTTYIDKNTGKILKVVNSTSWYMKEAASPLGCKLQDQVCNPNKPRDTGCTPLSPAADVVTNSVAQFDGDQDGALARLRWWSKIVADDHALHYTIRILGAHALTARYRLLSDSTQASIPDNQWMLDVQHWMEISLAVLQQAVVQGAQGPSNPVEESLYTLKPNSSVEWDMCLNQKVLSREHSSLSVLGLGITLGIGLLIIILSYVLDPLMTYLQKKRGVAEYQRLEWTTNSIFNLQRLAYEGAGQGGTWSNVDGDIPVTEKGQVLAGLDIEDRRHPRIERRVGDGDEVKGEVVEVEVFKLGKKMTRETTWASKGTTVAQVPTRDD